jgi:aryl-alcohol dehydrogenase-like predicted oxidoreductase
MSNNNLSQRTLGNSDLHITSIGLGAWAIGGNNWEGGWGAQEDEDSIASIHRALELGINWIDTAPSYGLGHSEEVVGQALAGLAKKPLVFTKCAVCWNPDRSLYYTLKPDSIVAELEASLLRLKIDAIDLYQIHWPKPEEEVEQAWETLAKLKEQGKVRNIGVSNFSVEQMKRAQKIAPITSLQPPYSMVLRDIEAEILPFCLANNIGVLNYAPMASGLLTGHMTRERLANLPEDDWRSKAALFTEPAITRNLALIDLLWTIGAEHGVEPGVIAIAWTLKNPAITAAIVGARSAEQIEGTLPAATFRLSDAEYARINDYLAAHPL